MAESSSTAAEYSDAASNFSSTYAESEGICYELEACNGDFVLDDKVKDFENTVMLQRQQSGKPPILGIVGLGGAGKTTLAKEFFNRKSSDYSKACFLFDIRENASIGGLISLQKKLLRSLNVSADNIDSVDEGSGMLSQHLSSSRALIILDDVDHVDQVDALLPHPSHVHSDSLVVITSRNKDVLTRSNVENTSIYKLTGLSIQQSKELFCSHAFKQPYPQPGFESLVLEFLKRCNGLPLSLKVFGALLYGKDISEWEDELESLRQILPGEIQQSLKISYNSLNKDEQQIFLDIACFVIGKSMDMAVRIWDTSGWQGWRVFETLRNKCLVEVDSENNIQMHDHLRDMGRDIAEEIYGLPRPLWSWTKNAIEPLWQHSLNGHVIIPVRGNDIDDDDWGIVATPDSNPVQGNDRGNDIDDDDSGIVATPDSNPVQGNDRGYVQNISSLFATCHGAILAVVALIMSAPVSSAVRIFILFISALVSVAIIRDLVVKSYKEFSAKRGQQSLRNSLVANQWWVTPRIVLFLIFIMLSLCLLLASNRMLRLHHH